MVDILQNFFGLGALVFGIFAYQSNKHRNILIAKVFAELFFAFQYFLLGAYSGTFMNFIGVTRNLTLCRKISKRMQIAATSFFLVLILSVSALSWQGPITLLAMFGKSCTTISYSFKNPKLLRYFTVPSCVAWFVYDLLTGSVAGMIYESLGLVSIIIASIRFRKTKFIQEDQRDESNAR